MSQMHMKVAQHAHAHLQVKKQAAASYIALHAWVVLETLVAVVTLAMIGLAVFLFTSGTQILGSNIERAGVRVSRTAHGGETTFYGSFVARSDCTHVDVLTDVDGEVPVVYLTETEREGCDVYRNPLPYTFAASFDGRYTGPLAVYMNGDRIATLEE